MKGSGEDEGGDGEGRGEQRGERTEWADESRRRPCQSCTRNSGGKRHRMAMHTVLKIGPPHLCMHIRGATDTFAHILSRALSCLIKRLLNRSGVVGDPKDNACEGDTRTMCLFDAFARRDAQAPLRPCSSADSPSPTCRRSCTRGPKSCPAKRRWEPLTPNRPSDPRPAMPHHAAKRPTPDHRRRAASEAAFECNLDDCVLNLLSAQGVLPVRPSTDCQDCVQRSMVQFIRGRCTRFFWRSNGALHLVIQVTRRSGSSGRDCRTYPNKT